MKRLLCFLLVLELLAYLCQAVTVTQNVPLIITKAGKKVEIPCEHDDNSGSYNMYWYQQKPGEGMKLMALSIASSSPSMENDFEGTWNMSRPNTTNSLLRKKEAKSEDTAVYFCASSMGAGNIQYFGGGTVLHVLETNEQQKLPQVKIFPPNKKEFKDHNLISLVCVASGFYPEHVRLNWTINGEPRNGLYQNVASKNKDGKSFSTSKRLTLTRSEYFNPDNKFRCEAGFIGNSSDAFDEVNGESDCGVSKESYAMYINQGKISYIMVLFKSGLYALIVLAIIWRRKVLSGSC